MTSGWAPVVFRSVAGHAVLLANAPFADDGGRRRAPTVPDDRWLVQNELQMACSDQIVARARYVYWSKGIFWTKARNPIRGEHLFVKP